ncbi:class I SAM-dependent methyltransferase [Pelagibacterium lacus]|uniref:class I SAM-dependent methyltransferase n=1 Tax=Pelagibacterium lacus TaxID=2282655 RepID=UPI0013149BB1|nr:class I SAM-dependent methyltransferase [Pelagibacterium lacus]
MSSRGSEASFWNGIAGKYARSPVKDQASYSRTLDATLALTGPDSLVYEMGCGTGSTALHLARHVARVVATDVSDEMIRIARGKAVGVDNVEFRVESAEDVGLAGAFDLAVCFNTLHLIADRQAAIQKIHKALKTGGHFVSKTPCLGSISLILAPIIGVMAALGQAPRVYFFSQDELIRSIEAAGFEIVSVEGHDAKRPQARPFIVARKC